MPVSDTEKKLLAQIRTRLANRGKSGFTADEIRAAIALHHTGELETITDDIKAVIVDYLISQRSNQNTPIAYYPTDSGETSGETEELPENPPMPPEPPESDPEMISMLSTVTNPPESSDTVSMVRHEASSMGVTISDAEVNNIAQQVQQTDAFNQDQIGAIKDALIAFIDWQHSQTSQGLTGAIAQVSSHAANRQVEFNNQMVGEVNNFFRVTQQNSQNNYTSILGALQIPNKGI